MKKLLLLSMLIALVFAGCNKKEDESTKVSEININKTTLTLVVGESEQLTMSFKPENAELNNVVWTSSDTSVIKVDNKGLVYAKALGSALVELSASNKKAICEVTVVDSYVEVTGITLNTDSLALFVGDSAMLEAEIKPEDATLTTLKWESSNEGIVEVNFEGQIVAKGVGQAEITAYADNVKAVCKVTVVEKNSEPSVYVVGHSIGNQDIPSAMAWENGEAIMIEDGDIIYSVFALEDDVYYGGYGNENGIQVARVWKNGVATTLTDGTRNAWVHSVYVVGSDVYAAGNTTNNYGKFVATMWKNGEETVLSEGASDAFGNSIFVSEGNVYVVGWEKNSASKLVSKLWLNGNETILSDETKDECAYAVYVYESDVYVAGYGINSQNIAIAKLWKNGESISLTDGTTQAYANYLYVSEGDVYVVGQELNSSYKVIGKLWKNGEVSDLSDGTYSTWVNSVFVSGEDVYAAGFQMAGSNYQALYWKNGEVNQLPCEQKGSKAYSIFFK